MNIKKMEIKKEKFIKNMNDMDELLIKNEKMKQDFLIDIQEHKDRKAGLKKNLFIKLEAFIKEQGSTLPPEFLYESDICKKNRDAIDLQDNLVTMIEENLALLEQQTALVIATKEALASELDEVGKMIIAKKNHK